MGRFGDAEYSAEATLAVNRFRRITAKLGPDTRAAIVKIGTDVASAAIRNQIGV